MEHIPELADLLAIWPIAESLAMQTPVGDLITLSRSSTSLRSALHGQILPTRTEKSAIGLVRHDELRPPVGHHQTSDWAQLKSIAPFVCSSTTHTRGQKTKPCKYCSRPICDACIVRDSFKRPNEKTFQNRLRYFCKECWSEGRPTQSFKYPVLPIRDDATVHDKPRVEVEGDTHSGDADEFCKCNLKDDGWLCLECKSDQNSSALTPTKSPEVRSIQCHGLDCTNVIDEQASDKDRRRVCLWCQHPLRRQWGGEDRYAWNLKTWAIRSANAESRSRDFREYNRRRLKTLRMSRGEMRGTSGPGDDRPDFVRHLDTVNYRIWLPETCVPDPEAVWKSKNGYWTYHRNFLVAVQQRCKRVNFTDVNGVNVSDMSASIQSASLPHARLNKNTQSWYFGPWSQWRHDQDDKLFKTRCLEELRARILDLYFAQDQNTTGVITVLAEQYGISVGQHKLQRTITRWLEKPTRTSGLDDGLDMDEAEAAPESDTGGNTTRPAEGDEDTESDSEEEQATDEAGRDSEWDQIVEPSRLVVTAEPLLEIDLPERPGLVDTHTDFITVPGSSTSDQHEDEPPPYNA